MKYRILTIFLLFFLLFSPFQGKAAPWNFFKQLPDKESSLKLDRPISMAVDEESKRYYIVDAPGGTLISFDRDGKFLTSFNAGGELKQPVAMAKGLRGVLWVIERAANQLLYIHPGVQQVRRFDLNYPDGTLIFPARVAVDSQGQVLVLDKMRGAVLRLDNNLKVESILIGQGTKGIIDFKVKGSEIWALEAISGKILGLSKEGSLRMISPQYTFEFPVSLELDDAGQIYILDRHTGTVAVFGPQGDFRYDFLGQGQRHGKLWYPSQIMFDWERHLCVVDEGNNRVDVFSR